MQGGGGGKGGAGIHDTYLRQGVLTCDRKRTKDSLIPIPSPIFSSLFFTFYSAVSRD